MKKSLKEKNKSIGTEHCFEYRPWGKFEVLLDSKECKVKRLFVDPFKSLSYQYHLKRSEHWTIVSGEATVILNGITKKYSVGESIIIKNEVKHSISNQKEINKCLGNANALNAPITCKVIIKPSNL